jgi:predicted transcriptional regulator
MIKKLEKMMSDMLSEYKDKVLNCTKLTALKTIEEEIKLLPNCRFKNRLLGMITKQRRKVKNNELVKR